LYVEFSLAGVLSLKSSAMSAPTQSPDWDLRVSKLE